MITDMGPLQVRIPVQIRDGRFTFFGGALPPFKENANAEIVIDAAYVDDKWLVEILDSQTQVLMLPAGKEVRLILRNPHAASLPAHLLKQRVEKNMTTFPQGLSGVYIVLYAIEDLMLMLRGPKPGQLAPCTVFIPDLQLEVPSLNQAYAEISRAFEPHRRSFGGNVFSNFFYEDQSDQGPVWRSLASLRDHLARPDIAALKDSLFPWYFRRESWQPENPQWAYPAVVANDIITLYLLDAQGRVSAELYFTESDDVNEWLSDSGYQRYHPPFRPENGGRPVEASPPDKDDYQIGPPPNPPYRKPNGETAMISYSRFDRLGLGFPRSRQIR